MIKKYEFWHPRIFEAPFYAFLGYQCLLNRIGIRSLAKANYCLDHGEIGIGSKLDTQLSFNQDHFLPTMRLPHGLSREEKERQLLDFVEQHQYPIILKSDVGCVGKGVCKISSDEELRQKAPLLLGDYIVQKFTSNNHEYGVFYIRSQGRPQITGINKKHFPTVTGNGRDSLLTLAQNHPRHTPHWGTFLQYFDTSHIPEPGKEVQLSFIGSHTMGCKFTDDTHLVNPQMEQAIFGVFEDQPGFNFGRMDVKAPSDEAFRRGEFVVIEVNGIASLPTHMFDPRYSVWQAYKIFFEHAKYLAQIAREHKHQRMDFLPAREIINRIKTNQSMLNQVHSRLMGD